MFTASMGEKEHLISSAHILYRIICMLHRIFYIPYRKSCYTSQVAVVMLNACKLWAAPLKIHMTDHGYFIEQLLLCTNLY